MVTYMLRRVTHVEKGDIHVEKGDIHVEKGDSCEYTVQLLSLPVWL